MSGTQNVEIEDKLDKELEYRARANAIGKGDGNSVETKDENREKYMDEPVRWTPFESFEEMEVAEETQEKAQEKAREINKLAEVLTPMVSNIVYNNEESAVIESKVENVFTGFMSRLKSLFSKKSDEMEDDKSVSITDISDENNTFTVYKGSDGQLLWLSSYSNNIRDNDYPPEIISSKSHKNFVSKVDSGEVPLPEMWLWHESNWKMGEATVVAYDDETGAAIAGGFFYKEAEPIALAIKNSKIDWGVSHGMPSMQIKRSAEDPTILVEHVTKEISPLPHFAAANKFAGFIVLKEANMALQGEKRSQLEKAGFPVEALDSLDAMNKAKSDVADNLALDRKEADIEPEVQEPQADEKSEEQNIEEQVVKEQVLETEEATFSDKQLSELQSAFSAFGEKLVAELPAMIQSAVEEKMKPLIEEQERIKEADAQAILESTPVASLRDMLLNSGPLLKSQSATESKDTIVDGRTKLAKSGPEETDFEDAQGPFDLTATIIKGITTGSYKNTSAFQRDSR